MMRDKKQIKYSYQYKVLSEILILKPRPNYNYCKIKQYWYVCKLRGKLRHEGLTPALAPPRPAMTEDELQASRGRKCDSTAKGYVRDESCLSEEQENTGFNEPATKNCLLARSRANRFENVVHGVDHEATRKADSKHFECSHQASLFFIQLPCRFPS